MAKPPVIGASATGHPEVFEPLKKFTEFQDLIEGA
jgi:hypothetical protein